MNSLIFQPVIDAHRSSPFTLLLNATTAAAGMQWKQGGMHTLAHAFMDTQPLSPAPSGNLQNLSLNCQKGIPGISSVLNVKHSLRAWEE